MRLLLLLFFLSSCSAVSNFSNFFTGDPIIHLSERIDFVQIHKEKINLYIKISDLTSDNEVFAETELLNFFTQNSKYNVVSDANMADIIINVKITSVVPIEKETVDHISKYWIYKNISGHTVINNSTELENNKTDFIIEDEGFITAIGPGKHSIRNNTREKQSSISEFLQPDIITGATIGGTLFGVFGFSPAMIALGTAAGGGAVSLFNKLMSCNILIATVDINIKEKIKQDITNKVNIKHKNITNISKNSINEVYIENSSNQDVFVYHSAQISVINESLGIFYNKISQVTNYAIIKIFKELLR